MFAELVRAHRRRLGLTQEELAEATGLSLRGIGKLESGRIASPRGATVRLLADAFGLTGTDRQRFCEAANDGPPAAPARAPAQLPPDVPAFTGRQEQLERLDALLGDAADLPAPVFISAIAGTAGVGKTALAVHWAHRAAARFPDGQLYVNLRGYDPDQPVSPADALAGLLKALGVAGRDVPVEIEERTARYRSELAGRRVLVVLDNAATVEQVRPLLPGSGPSTVVVTSRDRLAGLVALHGAHRLDLDLLPHADAIALLRRLVGPRADAEPDAIARLADQCARLPLALRVAAELAASRPASRLADLVTELTDRQRRLDLLDAGGDPHGAVRAVFSWSVRHLPGGAAGTFRWLGMHPGPDLDRYAAAALAGTDLEQARRDLDLLARAHLLHRGGPDRYAMHDLLRGYAAELAGAERTDQQRRAALGRLFDYYLAAAAAAMDSWYPAEAHDRPRIPIPATSMPELADPDSARSWLDTELPCLIAMAAHTAAHGWPAHTTRLSRTLCRFLDGGQYQDALAVHRHAHYAAGQLGDLAEQAHALRHIGAIHGRLGQHGPAVEYLQRALTLFRQVGDQASGASVLNNLGALEVRHGRHAPATDHFQQALAGFGNAGDRTGQAIALTNLGLSAHYLGRYQQAAEHHRRALAAFRELGHTHGQAHALSNLGAVEERLGHYETAVAQLEPALALFRKLGDTRGEARALNRLGTTFIRLGKVGEATEAFEQALAHHREIGERDGEARALNGLGEAAHIAASTNAALTHLVDALAVATEIENRDQQASAHTGLGHIHRTVGDVRRARAHYQQALELYTELGLPEAKQVRTYLNGLSHSRAQAARRAW